MWTTHRMWIDAELSSPVPHECHPNVSKPFLSQIHFLAVGSSAITGISGTVVEFMLCSFSYILLLLQFIMLLFFYAKQRLRTIAILDSRQAGCDLRVCLLSDPPWRL